MSVSAIALVVSAGVEPSAVLWIDKEAFTGTDVFILGDGEDLRGSITRRGLGGPHADFIAIIKHKTIRATILENCVVIFVLIELDTAVEPGTVFWMPVVALARAL